MSEIEKKVTKNNRKYSISGREISTNRLSIILQSLDNKMKSDLCEILSISEKTLKKYIDYPDTMQVGSAKKIKEFLENVLNKSLSLDNLLAKIDVTN